MIQDKGNELEIPWFKLPYPDSPTISKCSKKSGAFLPNNVNTHTIERIVKVAESAKVGEIFHYKKKFLDDEKSFFLEMDGERVKAFVITKEFIDKGGSGKVRGAVAMIFKRSSTGLVFLHAYQAVKHTTDLSLKGNEKKAKKRIYFSEQLKEAKNVVQFELKGLFKGKNNQTKLAIFMVRYTGDLITFSYRRASEKIRVENAIFFLREMAKALQEIHSRNIIHRDLNPSNCLLKYLSDQKITACALADFDLSTQMPLTPEDTKNICGTFIYSPPELSAQLYHQIIPGSCDAYFKELKNPDFSTLVGPFNDIYLLGACTYIVWKGGYPPLLKINKELKEFRNLKSKELVQNWNNQLLKKEPTQGELMDYLFKLMDPIPDKRPKAQEILEFIEPFAEKHGI